MDDDRDPEAFRALYRAHYGTVCRYVAARAGSDLVEDVAAETFLVAWRRQTQLPTTYVVPWLLNTAGKCLANQRRTQERSDAVVQRITRLAAPASEGTSLGTAVQSRAQRRAVISALAQLRPGDRELLLLRLWDGLAPREVALVVGHNPVVVRTRLHRASRRLQHALRAALVDEDVPCSAPTVTSTPLEGAS